MTACEILLAGGLGIDLGSQIQSPFPIMTTDDDQE